MLDSPRCQPWLSLTLLPAAALLALASPDSGQDCAYPTTPLARTLLQPDGTEIELYFRGTGANHWYEDPAGYPVVKSADGYHYAIRAADGTLAATALFVGTVDPAGHALEPHVVPAPKPRAHALRAASEKPVDAGSGPRGVFALGAGSVDNLVLLLRFSDHGPLGQNRTLPSSTDVGTIMNAVGGDPVLAPTGSVRDHYLEGSYGQFTIDSTVVGWLDLPHSESYYANGSSGLTTLTWDLITDALAAADPLVDFGDFDVDGDGWVDAITFLHSGYGAEWGGTDQYGTDYSDRMWSHKWTIPTWTSAEGVKVGDYNISPGLWATSGSGPGRIGVVCHELGHFFGLPDLYDTDGSSSGVGNWCLMAAGSWGFDGSQHFPSHMSAWSKLKLGWIAPQRLLPGAHVASQIETNAELYMFDSGYPQGEYLLIENRQQVGFDSALPQGGLAIWHVDEGKGCFTNNNPNNDEGYPGQPGWPTNGSHHRLALLQADGAFDLEQDFGRGNSGDVYRAGFATSLTPTSTPDSKAYQGGVIVSNGNRVQSIGASSANMSFVCSNTSNPSVTSTSLPAAFGGYAYATTLTSSGGTAPVAWSEFRDAPSYTLADLGPQPFTLTGVAQGFRDDEGVWSVSLPFLFPYYETSYAKVYVTPNGCVDLAPLENEYYNTTAFLRCLPRIAALWDDLATDGSASNDIYVDTSVSGQVRIRWRARTVNTSSTANFSITLFQDGRIRYDYGTGNTNLTPTVGISRTHSGDLIVADSHDAQTSLGNANSLEFTLHGSQLPPGLTLSSSGVLSGTPTTPGTYTFRVQVKDANNRYDLKSLTLNVFHPRLRPRNL